MSANAEDALDELEGSMPDLMLVDLSWPRMSGIELIRELHLRQPDLRCAILSGHRAPAYVRQAMEAGADGYLLKGDPMEIDCGLQAFVAGKRYFSPELRNT